MNAEEREQQDGDERIWLFQAWTMPFLRHEWEWAISDRKGERSIEYIRADIVEQIEAQARKEALQKAADIANCEITGRAKENQWLSGYSAASMAIRNMITNIMESNNE